VATLVSGAGAEPARPLRVITFNLLHGGPSSGLDGDDQQLERRLEMVVDELRALAPDVLALQEASIGRQRGNVAQRLAERLRLHHVHAPATERVFRSGMLGRLVVRLLNFSEGPAILSRFPIVRSEVHDLPRCARWFDPRVLLAAEVATPTGPLQVYSTHTARDDCQPRRVAELVAARRGLRPSILMGDLNVREDSLAIAAMVGHAGFVDAYRAANPTLPGLTVWQRIDAPEPTVFRRVDYVFLVPGRACAGLVRSSRVVLDTPRRSPSGGTLWPSDHYGVLAEIDVSPAACAAPTPGIRS
jgi:endonuclease/exonuclease/phosphatase family metal-dependent hydrolase